MAWFLLNSLAMLSATPFESKQTPANGKNAIGAAEILQLNEEFSREEIPELVRMFSDEGSLLLGRMETAIEQQDSEALGRAAHALRGAGVNFGAHLLDQLCQQVEALAQAWDCARATVLLLQVRDELGRVQTALETEFDSTCHEQRSC